MNTALIIIIILLALVLLVFIAVGIVFYFAFCRLPIKPDPKNSAELAPYAEEIEAGSSWFKAQRPQRISIASHDGLELVGHLLPAENARATLILVHGYRGSPWVDFGVVYEFYASLGYNLLTIHQRAHGESGGKLITFGVKERLDVCRWAQYVADRFGPGHGIVLDGISMGGATVLMALGTELPSNVRCIIADCGYTSPRAEFEHVIKSRMHLPVAPMLAIAEIYTRLLGGFGFDDASTVSALEKTDIPVLFVHGEDDNFVPTRFSRENHAACRSENLLVTVPGAGHGMSYLMDTENCQKILRDFLERYA